MADSPTFRARKGWSAAASRASRDITAANPTLEKARLTSLFAACDLISEADNMQKVIDADGFVVTGSQGQPVAHPLVAEVRQYRRAAIVMSVSTSLTRTPHARPSNRGG